MLFKEKMSKFGSLISLVTVLAMLMLFFLSLPQMLVSVSGRIFAAVWVSTAILVFIAHARRLSREPRYYDSSLIAEKDGWIQKEGSRRFLRG